MAVYNASKEHKETSSPRAVVDTSFWSLACRVQMVSYLSQIWSQPLWMPPQVEKEIGVGSYPDQIELVGALAENQVVVRAPMQLVTTQFRGKGEQEVFSLAHELGATALINDWAAHDYARYSLGLSVLSLPGFLIMLLLTKWINVATSGILFASLNSLGGTSQSFLDDARLIIRQQGGQV